MAAAISREIETNNKELESKLEELAKLKAEEEELEKELRPLKDEEERLKSKIMDEFEKIPPHISMPGEIISVKKSFINNDEIEFIAGIGLVVPRYPLLNIEQKIHMMNADHVSLEGVNLLSMFRRYINLKLIMFHKGLPRLKILISIIQVLESEIAELERRNDDLQRELNESNTLETIILDLTDRVTRLEERVLYSGGTSLHKKSRKHKKVRKNKRTRKN
jgi:cell division protein FtsB